jgi:hypothetical protein
MLDIQTKQRRVGRPENISARGLEMLFSIWRYRSAGTKALHRLVAPQDGVYGLSKELIKLADKGLIWGEKVVYTGYQWSLTPKGYLVLEPLIGERLGIPSAGIEKSLSEFHEVEKMRWYAANQKCLVFQQVLLAVCGGKNPESVFSRELTASRVRIAHTWLPQLGSHLPDCFVSWSDSKRTRVFAIEYFTAHRGLRKNMELANAYKRIKVDGIFLILENPRLPDGQPRTDLHNALYATEWASSAKWHILREGDLASGLAAVVYNVEDKPVGSLGQVLGVSPQSGHQSHKLSALIADLHAKPKVWGRAYQRE